MPAGEIPQKGEREKEKIIVKSENFHFFIFSFLAAKNGPKLSSIFGHVEFFLSAFGHGGKIEGIHGQRRIREEEDSYWIRTKGREYGE